MHAPERDAQLSSATLDLRRALAMFIERELAPHNAVRAVVGIGSIASGHAHAGSDIDAVVFLKPFDPFITPAEFRWRAADNSYHSVFSDVDGADFDFARFDYATWSAPWFEWPEGRRAELASGWIAFDRDGTASQLIAERTTLNDAVRTARLDEAVTWLNNHLGEGTPEAVWERLGPAIAHDRLSAAYHYLTQALFAYNWRWRPWRNREMQTLLALPWLPEGFDEQVLIAVNAPSLEADGYMARVETLLSLFADVLERCTVDGMYGDDPISEAFVRSHAEPGRAWNMAEWNREHRRL